MTGAPRARFLRAFQGLVDLGRGRLEVAQRPVVAAEENQRGTVGGPQVYDLPDPDQMVAARQHRRSLAPGGGESPVEWEQPD